MDDPEHSVGDNPDVIADFDSEAWGLACKVPNGTSATTLYDRVKEGVNQIEKSRATRGFVVLNFKNVFDHRALMPALDEEQGDVVIGTHSDHWYAVDPSKCVGSGTPTAWSV